MKTRTLALVFLIGFLLVLPGHVWGAGEQVKLDPVRVAVDFPATTTWLPLVRLDASGLHLLTSFSGPITRTETLSARSLLALIVAFNPDPARFAC